MQPLPSSLEAAPDACVVMTTLPSNADAEKMAGLLLNAQLAACVQLLPIQSFYVWQGQRCQEPEVLLMIKTRRSLFAELQAFIQAQHPYEVPEILQLPVEAGAAPYLAWLQAQTRSAAA